MALRTYGDKPTSLQVNEKSEYYYIGSEVENYLRLFRGSLYKRYPGLLHRTITNDEKKYVIDLGLSAHCLTSNILLLRAADVEDIIDGNDERYKAVSVPSTEPSVTSSDFTSSYDSKENNHQEDNNSSNCGGTRRSTRKRKLKYNNYCCSPNVVDEDEYDSKEDEDDEKDDKSDYDYDNNGESDYESSTEESCDQPVNSKELNNSSDSEDYLTSINSSNIKNKKEATKKLKQCSFRQTNKSKDYKLRLHKAKPTVKRFQTQNKKNIRVNSPLDEVQSCHNLSSSESNCSNIYDNLTSGNQANSLIDNNSSKSSQEDLPVVVDSSIGFHNVGGLKKHIDCLREMVVFPMIYRNVFEMFKQHPAKGVIFHGPPGTGKTLLARALANECSEGGQKVSFFQCKSHDILSKWIGESESRLKRLFDKANEMSPSIIFIDELDGLVPVRSDKQDQSHNSIVTTMLSMMDGLEDRGNVIVIGATNRIDSIDPAVRRPGRFDKELYFSLPTDKERLQILHIIMSKWMNCPSNEILIQLSEETVGYTGADLNSLCSESVLQALNRTYPQIYKTSKKLILDTSKIQVQMEDFEKAMHKIVPTTERNIVLNSKKLPIVYRPLYENILKDFIYYTSQIFPQLNSPPNQRLRVTKAPRLLVHSLSNSKNSLVVPAFLQHFENCYKHSLSGVTLFSTSVHSPEEAITQIFKELPKHLPAILYIPNIGELWTSLSDSLKQLFIELLGLMDITIPVLVFATSFNEFNNLPKEVLSLFLGAKQKHSIPNPSDIDIHSLYSLLINKVFKSPKIIEKQSLKELPITISIPSCQQLKGTELKDDDDNNSESWRKDCNMWEDESTSKKTKYSTNFKDYDCFRYSTLGGFDKLTLCKQELTDFINKDIMTFWRERINSNIYHKTIDDGIIDLFSLLDNKIGEFNQKNDRSTLLMELKKEFEDFKTYYKELEKNK